MPVKLGELSSEQVQADQPAPDNRLLFLPGGVLPGIMNADPMVSVRQAAYPNSYGQRQ
jgi:catalase